MSDGFFDDHPLLGSAFDFDHDGRLDFDEAIVMGGVLGAYADEVTRDYDDDYDDGYSRKKKSYSWDDDGYDSDDDDDDDDGYDSDDDDY